MDIIAFYALKHDLYNHNLLTVLRCKFNQLTFKDLINNNSCIKNTMSALFNNIDGNHSNFDNFVCEVSQYCHSFSFIGISETNINPCRKDLYTIPGYKSEYNAKASGKRKGSGIALYIKDSYTYNRMELLCQCTKNMETLFIQTTNTSEPLYIGVVYRPPSGCKSDVLAEFEKIIKSLPGKRVLILGDFNDDLFKLDSQDFESLVYSNSMTPLISLATHFKPGFNPSLIDNILTNPTENFKLAGVFESGVSHHRPIFCFFDDAIPKLDNNDDCIPKYDYCESNLINFEREMEIISHKSFEYSESNFEKFIEDIKDKIDVNFKLISNTSSTSKRNISNNPWIYSRYY